MRHFLVIQFLILLMCLDNLYAQQVPQDSIYEKKWTSHIELNNGSGLGAISTSIGRFENNLKAYQLRLSQTYKVSDELHLGVGMGYDRYGNISMLPLFGELRTDMSKTTKIVPYIVAKMGYSIGRMANEGINGRNLGGVMWQMGLGISFKLNHYQVINTSLNILGQQFRFDYFNRQGVMVLSENVGHSFLTFGIGYSF